MVTKMRAKSKAKKDMTKAELIDAITRKTKKIPARFQPLLERDFLASLKRKTNTQLRHILSRMRVSVDSTGYDIRI